LNNKTSKKNDNKKNYKQALLKAQKNNRAIHLLEEWHDSAFKKHNCLDCAHCCKNHSPRFNNTDIKRISKYLNVKERQFIEQYLTVDEDEDYVLQQEPCSFLNPDNTCMIYDVRPKDCARFPYTDEDVFINQSLLSLKNATFCPIAEEVLEQMHQHFINK